jgi:hypothetical protein
MIGARVAVVVVTFEARDHIEECLGSIDAEWVETVVVDNASTDGTPDLVASTHPGVALVRGERNEGFGRACNRGAAATTAPCVLFLNPDARLAPGALETLARVLDDDPAIGIVGPRTLNDDGTPQVSFGPALGLRAEWRQRRLVRGVRRRTRLAAHRGRAVGGPFQPDWVSPRACSSAGAFVQVGGFDEGSSLRGGRGPLRPREAAGWRALRSARSCTTGSAPAWPASPAARARVPPDHLRYYRKHNGAAATAVLRAGLAVVSVTGWVRGALRGDASARKDHAEALRLAVLG